MSLISIPNTFSAGAVIVASQHNSNFSIIYSDYNGNVDNTNIASGAGIVASKLILTSPGAIGTTAPAAIKATTLEATTTLKLGTTNQGDVLYDNGTSLVRLTPGTSGQFLKTQGAGANPIWATASSGIQFFASSGTFTAPTGITKVYITMIAGGGGGGGSQNTSSSGGGGSGAYLLNYPYTVVAGNNYTVTVGAGGAGGTNVADGSIGGTTTFDTLSVLGGSGGISAAGGSAAGNGGAGGSGAVSYATTNISSALNTSIGIIGWSSGAKGDNANSYGGNGGNSLFGTSTGHSGQNTTGNAGTANTGVGGGGTYNNATGSVTGGAGGSGFVLVQY